jgi:hypothetical protein
LNANRAFRSCANAGKNASFPATEFLRRFFFLIISTVSFFLMNFAVSRLQAARDWRESSTR